MNQTLNLYSPSEERFNVISHLIGFILSIIGLVFLIVKASMFGNVWHIVSFTIFGVSMALLYAASTSYHNAKRMAVRKKLKIFDHAAIYVLIAGTYTPFALVTLHGLTGWVIFGITWGLALIGIILKLFYAGRFKLISTLMYLSMGWVVVFAIQKLINNLSVEGSYWAFIGGAFYTVGAVFYMIKKIPFNHGIFHVFVLLGSFCHFITVYYYV